MILDGRLIKKEKIEIIKEKISKLDRIPGLVVIQVGHDPASDVYVKNKEKTALELGCHFEHITFEDNVTNEEIINKINELNNNKNIDGIIVQCPLPKHLDTELIQNKVLSNKDIDGLTDINIGRLMHNKPSLVACTPKGIMTMLDYYKIDVSGKNVVIVGRSNLVGKPLIGLLLNRNATVTICHSHTKDISSITKNADILIVAIGKSKFITKDMVKKDSIIIDVGINRINGILTGDVDFDNVVDKVSFITPVPSGVGQMTVLSIYENLLEAYELNR